MHGAARINYTAGKPRAHCLVQHVGKWGKIIPRVFIAGYEFP